MVLRSVADMRAIGREAAGPHTTIRAGVPGRPRSREPVVDEPAFFCAASTIQKEVVLAVRGTSTVQDVATDVRAAPAPFPPSSDEEWVLDGDAFAFAGMARAAEYVYRESYDALKAVSYTHLTLPTKA